MPKPGRLEAGGDAAGSRRNVACDGSVMVAPNVIGFDIVADQGPTKTPPELARAAGAQNNNLARVQLRHVAIHGATIARIEVARRDRRAGWRRDLFVVPGSRRVHHDDERNLLSASCKLLRHLDRDQSAIAVPAEAI